MFIKFFKHLLTTFKTPNQKMKMLTRKSPS